MPKQKGNPDTLPDAETIRQIMEEGPGGAADPVVVYPLSADEALRKAMSTPPPKPPKKH